MIEVISQLMFLIGIGSLPLSVALLVFGVIMKSRLGGTFCIAAVPFAVAHCFWYIDMLGIGLADKIGNADYPSWSRQMLFASVFSLPLGFSAFRCKKKQLSDASDTESPK